jgi:hypothetical protein
MQTQQKCRFLHNSARFTISLSGRDNRNRAEQALVSATKIQLIIRSFQKRQSVDLSDAGLNKELSDVLEREKDLIEQLRFTEDDLRRTRSQMKV